MSNVADSDQTAYFRPSQISISTNCLDILCLSVTDKVIITKDKGSS